MAAWIAPLIGAGIGLLGSRGGGGQQTTTNEPPWALRPLQGYIGQGGWQMGNLPFTPLPFNPTADFNPYQHAGFDMTADRAMTGGRTLGMSENALQGLLGGGGFNPYGGMMTPQSQSGFNPLANSNPYLDNIVSRTLDDVQGRMNTGSFNAGSLDNANLRKLTAEGLGDAANRLRFGDFTNQQQLMESQAGRDQQTNMFNVGNYANDLSRNAGLYQSGINNLFQGIQMAPQNYMAGYMPAQQMLGIGGTMQQQNQNQLNAGMNEFNRAQQWPFQTWNAMNQPFQQNLGGGTQTTTQPGQSPAAGLLGGALAGGQLWRMFNQPQNLSGIF